MTPFTFLLFLKNLHFIIFSCCGLVRRSTYRKLKLVAEAREKTFEVTLNIFILGPLVL